MGKRIRSRSGMSGSSPGTVAVWLRCDIESRSFRGEWFGPCHNPICPISRPSYTGSGRQRRARCGVMHAPSPFAICAHAPARGVPDERACGDQACRAVRLRSRPPGLRRWRTCLSAASRSRSWRPRRRCRPTASWTTRPWCGSMSRPTIFRSASGRRPGGRLLYQKTQGAADVAAGVRSFRFTRDLEDLELRPGAYPVETHGRGGRYARPGMVGTDDSASLRSGRPALPVALAVRVSSPPHDRPRGPVRRRPRQSRPPRATACARFAEAVLGDAGAASHARRSPRCSLQEWAAHRRRLRDGERRHGERGRSRVARLGLLSPRTSSS